MIRKSIFLFILIVISIQMFGEKVINLYECNNDSLITKIDTSSYSKSVDLKEVVVAQETQKQEANKTTYSITKEMRKNLVDMAKIVSELPGFTYDYTTRTVSYNNSQNIVVLVDSVERGIGALDVQHYRYSKIEITNHPTGKYSQADVLINLVTKKNYEGYEGNLYDQTYMLPEKTDKAFVTSEYVSGYTSYTRNKLTLSARGGYNYQDAEIYNPWKRHYKLSDIKDTSIDTGGRNFTEKINRGNLYLSADYVFNKNNSISFVYSTDMNDKRDYYENDAFTRTIAGKENGVYTRNQENQINSEQHSFAAYYRGKLGQYKYDIDYNYRFSPEIYKDEYSESSAYSYLVHFKDKMDFSRFSMFVNRTFLKEKLYVHMQYVNTWKQYNRKNYETSQLLNENSYLRNYVQAGFSTDLIKKTNIQGQIWGEHIHMKSMSNTESQIPFGWTLSTTYHLNDKNWMMLVYNSGISYPDKQSSSSYGYFTDSLTWTGGNPSLRSSTTQSLRFHIDLWRCFNFQTGFTLLPNRFSRIDEYRYGMLSTGSYGNYIANIPVNSNYRDLWASVSLTKRFCTNFLYKFDLKYSDTKTEYDIFKQEGHEWNGSTSLRYYCPRWLTTFYVSYQYISRIGIDPQGWSHLNLDYVTLHVEKEFFNRKLNVSVDYNPPGHISKGSSEGEKDSPYKYEYRKVLQYERMKNGIILHASYRFAGGRSVRQCNKFLSEEL